MSLIHTGSASLLWQGPVWESGRELRSRGEGKGKEPVGMGGKGLLHSDCHPPKSLGNLSPPAPQDPQGLPASTPPSSGNTIHHF